MNAPIRVLLADDHAIVREGLRELLEEEPGLAVVAEAGDVAATVERAIAVRPDVALVDILMPDGSGIEALRRIRARAPEVRVVLLTSVEDESAIREAVAAGAAGYLLKDLSRAELVRAVRDAAAGRLVLHPEAQRILARPAEPSPLHALTPRERSVLELLAQGRSNRQIAIRLDLTEGTVKGYVSTIFDKLHVQDRTTAALLAVRHGLGAKRGPRPAP
ncbi:MAG TPA: response regulator transcription factor [Thermoanaerobaculia bacterium]|nr:response regulator transcription factor [Thermoanaerobaculia bacterium]